VATRLTVKAINSELGKGTRRGWRRQPDTFTSRAARQTGSTGRQSAIRSGHEGGGGEAPSGTRDGRRRLPIRLLFSPIVETCRTASAACHSPTPKALRIAPKWRLSRSTKPPCWPSQSSTAVGLPTRTPARRRGSPSPCWLHPRRPKSRQGPGVARQQRQEPGAAGIEDAVAGGAGQGGRSRGRRSPADGTGTARAGSVPLTRISAAPVSDA